MNTLLRALALAAGVTLVSASSFAASPSCNRSCLESVADRTFAALIAHDPARAPLARELRATENGAVVPAGEGLWRKIAGLTDYRVVVADPQASQVAWLGTVTQTDGKPLMLALRLAVTDGRVHEIEAVSGAPFEFPSSPLVAAPRPGLARNVPEAERLTRAQMISLAERNFDNILAADGSHFAPDCRRIENRRQ
jgi:hypothetical protein